MTVRPFCHRKLCRVQVDYCLLTVLLRPIRILGGGESRDIHVGCFVAV